MNKPDYAQQEADEARAVLEELIGLEQAMVDQMLKESTTPNQDEQMRVTCTNCGAEFDASADKCPQCGTPRPPDMAEPIPVSP